MGGADDSGHEPAGAPANGRLDAARSRRRSPRPTCTRSCARWPTGRATCRSCATSSRRTRPSCSSRAAASAPNRRTRPAVSPADALVAHAGSGAPDHDLTDRTSSGGSSGSSSGPASTGQWETFLDRGARARGDRSHAARRGTSTRSDGRSAAPSSARAPRAWPRRTGCARPGSTSRSSRRTATSAAPGWRTSTRAAGSTCPTSSTASRSRRPTTGSRASRPSRTCWPTSRGWPRSSSWATCIRFSSEVTEARFDEEARVSGR